MIKGHAHPFAHIGATVGFNINNNKRLRQAHDVRAFFADRALRRVLSNVLQSPLGEGRTRSLYLSSADHFPQPYFSTCIICPSVMTPSGCKIFASRAMLRICRPFMSDSASSSKLPSLSVRHAAVNIVFQMT